MNHLLKLNSFTDKDGILTSIESGTISGFNVKRIFWIFGVPPQSTRANHACMNASICLVAISGSVKIYAEKHNKKEHYELNNRNMALFADPGTWIKAYDFSKDGVLICLSDKDYDECVYIDNYDVFLKNTK